MSFREVKYIRDFNTIHDLRASLIVSFYRHYFLFTLFGKTALNMETSPFSIENILKPPTTQPSEDTASNSRTTEALTLAEKLAGKYDQQRRSVPHLLHCSKNTIRNRKNALS